MNIDESQYGERKKRRTLKNSNSIPAIRQSTVRLPTVDITSEISPFYDINVNNIGPLPQLKARSGKTTRLRNAGGDIEHTWDTSKFEIPIVSNSSHSTKFRKDNSGTKLLSKHGMHLGLEVKRDLNPISRSKSLEAIIGHGGQELKDIVKRNNVKLEDCIAQRFQNQNTIRVDLATIPETVLKKMDAEVNRALIKRKIPVSSYDGSSRTIQSPPSTTFIDPFLFGKTSVSEDNFHHFNNDMAGSVHESTSRSNKIVTPMKNYNDQALVLRTTSLNEQFDITPKKMENTSALKGTKVKMEISRTNNEPRFRDPSKVQSGADIGTFLTANDYDDDDMDMLVEDETLFDSTDQQQQPNLLSNLPSSCFDSSDFIPVGWSPVVNQSALLPDHHPHLKNMSSQINNNTKFGYSPFPSAASFGDSHVGNQTIIPRKQRSLKIGSSSSTASIAKMLAHSIELASTLHDDELFALERKRRAQLLLLGHRDSSNTAITSSASKPIRVGGSSVKVLGLRDAISMAQFNPTVVHSSSRLPISHQESNSQSQGDLQAPTAVIVSSSPLSSIERDAKKIPLLKLLPSKQDMRNNHHRSKMLLSGCEENDSIMLLSSGLPAGTELCSVRDHLTVNDNQSSVLHVKSIEDIKNFISLRPSSLFSPNSHSSNKQNLESVKADGQLMAMLPSLLSRDSFPYGGNSTSTSNHELSVIDEDQQKLRLGLVAVLNRIHALEGALDRNDGDAPRVTPRSKQAANMVQRMCRTVDQLQQIFTRDFQDGSSIYHQRVDASVQIQAWWRRCTQKRKFSLMRASLLRYRRRKLLGFGEQVLKWRLERDAKENQIKKCNLLAQQRLLRKIVQAWQRIAISASRDPTVAVRLANLQTDREKRIKKECFNAIKRASITMGLSFSGCRYVRRANAETPLDRAVALALEQRLGNSSDNFAMQDPSERIRASKERILQVAAYLVRDVRRKKLQVEHFTAWLALSRSRALVRTTSSHQEIKERAFFCWSLFVRQRSQARQLRAKFGLELLRRIFPVMRRVVKRENQLVCLSLDKWISYSHSLRSAPFKAWYVYSQQCIERRKYIESIIKAREKMRRFKLLSSVFESFNKNYKENKDKIDMRKQLSKHGPEYRSFMNDIGSPILKRPGSSDFGGIAIKAQGVQSFRNQLSSPGNKSGSATPVLAAQNFRTSGRQSGPPSQVNSPVRGRSFQNLSGIDDSANISLNSVPFNE